MTFLEIKFETNYQKRALVNSARPIENHEAETHGSGLIQVEKAFDIIQQTEKVHFRPVLKIGIFSPKIEKFEGII